MAPNPSASKERASRIPLDYYKRGDRLLQIRKLIAVAAALTAGGWAWWGLAHSPRQHSPGPLSSPHAMWNDECSACHQPFTPLGADAIMLTSDLPRTDQVQCQRCHVGAEHHTNLKTGEATNCAVCHREHRGQNASMVDVDDHACVDCHRNSPAHALHPEAVVQYGEFAANAVTGFTAETHPQFPALREDPGQLKFSHRRHLMPGQKLGANDRSYPKRLIDLPPDEREKYRLPGQTDDDEVQLSCVSCHRTGPVPIDVANFASFGTMPSTQPTDGAYVLPINYEKHCRACHPLEFYPNAELNLPPHAVAHGLAPKELKQAVRGAVLSGFVAGDPDFNTSFKPDRKLPQKPLQSDAESVAAWSTEKVAVAEKVVSDKCVQCHELKGPATERPVEPTNVPLVWYGAAKFDHGAHRALECKACHVGAYDYQKNDFKPGDSLLDHKQVMIPSLDVCAQCHAPRRADGTGGARFDCIECHRFHGADLQPSLADAASHRLPESKKTDLQKFLRGMLLDAK